MAFEKLGDDTVEMDSLEFEAKMSPLRLVIENKEIETWLNASLEDIDTRFAHVSHIQNLEERLVQTEKDIKALGDIRKT